MEHIDTITGKRLLLSARAALAAHLNDTPPNETQAPMPAMGHSGVFVTLRNQGALRGCIGTFSPEGALQEVVRDMAVAAACDPRFTSMPITGAELPDIRIELSILSPRVRIPDASGFEFGLHGVYLRNGHSSGCFLPDVGADLGWNRERFLKELCRQKAGLHEDAWQDSRTELYVFTVQKFTE